MLPLRKNARWDSNAFPSFSSALPASWQAGGGGRIAFFRLLFSPRDESRLNWAFTLGRVTSLLRNVNLMRDSRVKPDKEDAEHKVRESP